MKVSLLSSFFLLKYKCKKITKSNCVNSGDNMNEQMENYEEPSTSQELANMGRKAVGVVGDVGNLALGMGKRMNGKKDNDGKNDADKKNDEQGTSNNPNSLPKKDSLDDSNEDIKNIGKKAAKTGGKIAKEGAKLAGKGLKKLWALIPFPWNLIILGFIIIVILVLAIVMFSDDGSGGNCKYTEEVPYEYSCTQITISNLNLTLDFEDYVAGVVSGESYAGQNIEAIKAQAVLARTYALRVTNDCAKPIESSQKYQVYKDEYRDDAIEAAQATEGEVLVYDGSLTETMYDSFGVPCSDTNDCSSKCTGSTCSVTYTKLPNKETHTVTISSDYFKKVAGGHAYGMSQVASYEMADNGSTYEEILEYFYSDGVQIANHTSTNCDEDGSTDFAPRNNETGSLYADSEALSNIGAVAPNVSGLLQSASLKYQCVTYARLRAVEILLTTGVYDESTRAKAISIINNNSHNGWGWYSGGISALGRFNGDNSCTEFKPGSLISFKGNGSTKCCGSGYNGTCYCGHVAIVEDVDYENETVRITDMYTNLAGQYHELNLSYDALRSAYGGCLGTTYLLEFQG